MRKVSESKGFSQFPAAAMMGASLSLSLSLSFSQQGPPSSRMLNTTNQLDGKTAD